MTTALSPLAPLGVPARDAPVSVSSGPRPVALATGAESARAPRPVGAAAAEDQVRHHAPHERPVGPPPSFDINVLQDIREGLRRADDDATADKSAVSDESAAAAVPVVRDPVRGANAEGGAYAALPESPMKGEHLDHIV